MAPDQSCVAQELAYDRAAIGCIRIMGIPANGPRFVRCSICAGKFVELRRSDDGPQTAARRTPASSCANFAWCNRREVVDADIDREHNRCTRARLP